MGGINFEKDGEWWMAFKDFVTYFDQFELCNLSPDSLTDAKEVSNFHWCVSTLHGAWVEGERAGGCRNFLETFATNPQYRVTLVDVDEEDDDDLCTLIISLTQKGRKEEGQKNLTIGFVVYQIKSEEDKSSEK